MLAQFSIWALDDPNLRSEMAAIQKTLGDLGIKYEMGPMNTTLEGDMDEVFVAIKACHKALAGSHSRLLINITMDDDRAK